MKQRGENMGGLTLFNGDKIKKLQIVHYNLLLQRMNYANIKAVYI